MRLALMNWRQVEAHLKRKRTLIVPVGATEQHGPNGLMGTDTLIAEALANAIGERTETPVHPPLTVGMSQHHLAFAGTSSLSSVTYMKVLAEIIEAQMRHGWTHFFFVNGHGGNTTPAMAGASDLLTRRPELRWAWHSWWMHPRVKKLEDELFGDRNGDHASAAEIAMTHHLYPGSIESIEPVEIERPDFSWPMSPERFRETFPDGRMMSDPSLADGVKGRKLFELCLEVFSGELNRFEST